MKKIIYWILVFILLINSVCAIGIAPSHDTIFFKPGLEKELEFRIINQESKNLRLAIYARNELKDYIELPEKIITVNKNEYQKIVNYKIRLPKKLKPGEKKAEILVVDLGNQGDDKDILKASIGLIHQLNVIVPYPDQFVQGNMHVSSGTNNSTLFTISLYNLGKKDIEKINGNIIIRNPLGQGIIQLQTSSTDLKTEKKSKITAEWTSDVSSGTYNAEAIIEYDDKILILGKNFDVGNPLIEIIDLRTYPFKIGTVAKFDLILENKWNRQINNVFAKSKILDSMGSEIYETKTESKDIPAHATKEVSVFWDTKDDKQGDYLMEIQANYLGRVKEKLYELLVEQDKITVKNDQITGEVVKGQAQKSISIVSVLTIIIIIMTGIIFFLFRKQKSIEKTTYSHEEKYIQLKKYLKTKINQGYSVKALRDNLENKGWKGEIIDRILLDIEDEKI
ncbi:hypothetical protein GF327_08190 [Candidatus Woesearchaeota archaeon]|nr:hypothetical protein [Candidatus Woesearchaeota archaeon]